MPWEGSTRRQRLPTNWNRLRVYVLKRDPYCMDGRVCRGQGFSTEVDHIKRGDDHHSSNLQGICSDCHKAKSSAEGNQRG